MFYLVYYSHVYMLRSYILGSMTKPDEIHMNKKDMSIESFGHRCIQLIYMYHHTYASFVDFAVRTLKPIVRL